MKFDHSVLQKYVDNTFICHEKHPFADLHIYGYYPTPEKQPVWDAVTKYCRGIILDGEGNVVEMPFMKFWTFRQYLSPDLLLLNEGQIIRTPSKKFRITEKVDGTMVTLYWVGDTPYLATQRSFSNVKAVEATKILHSRYSHLFSRFDRSKTYVFEAIYPETKVLIDYGDMRDLILIGVIDKATGQPLKVPEDLGVITCKDYTEQYGHIEDLNELAALNLPNKEGFVLYYEDGSMVKLKFPWYSHAHSILDRFMKYERHSFLWYKDLSADIGRPVMPVITKDDIIESIRRGEDDFESIRLRVPSFYYLMGLEYWLHLMKNVVLTSEQALLFPQPEYFNFEERMQMPHMYETAVWMWEDRFLRNKI